MLRLSVMFLVVILNYVIQSTVLGTVAILGVSPDTSLILIVSYGILRGDVEGALFGFGAGLINDLFSGYVIGLYALLGMLVGFVSGKPFKDFFHDNYFLPFFMVILAMLCHQFLFYCGSILLTGNATFLYYTQTVLLPKTIYTASVAIPLYGLMHLLNHQLEIYERNRRSLFKGGTKK